MSLFKCHLFCYCSFDLAALANQLKCHYRDLQFEYYFDNQPPEGQSAACAVRVKLVTQSFENQENHLSLPMIGHSRVKFIVCVL